MMIQRLIEKGVNIPNPESVEIGNDVDLSRISGNDVTIHAGCKIFGKKTGIMQGVTIGYESPVTIDNCQIGPQVQLKGGFFKEAVFLKKASMGYGAHVREGSILEEEASGAHTVGLKQTILFPYVTLGSLINFCDCLMSGGTNRKNHSEVGSSYIHFNYTPNQDKATASLIGDVPRGVMLDQMPIFLGGQGGLVGPCRLEFGTVTAAGTICRKDMLKPGRLVIDQTGQRMNIPFTPGVYLGVKRILTQNVTYIGNLVALKQWYRHVRSLFTGEDMSEWLLSGLQEKVTMGINERIKQLRQFAEKMPLSVESHKKAGNDGDHLVQQIELYKNWTTYESRLHAVIDIPGNTEVRDQFLGLIEKQTANHGNEYIDVIQNLNEDSKIGTSWLQGIVDHVIETVGF